MTDYTDLIARLRRACYLAFDDGTNDYVSAPEAADAIEALQAEVARLAQQTTSAVVQADNE